MKNYSWKLSRLFIYLYHLYLNCVYPWKNTLLTFKFPWHDLLKFCWRNEVLLLFLNNTFIWYPCRFFQLCPSYKSQWVNGWVNEWFPSCYGILIVNLFHHWQIHINVMFQKIINNDQLDTFSINCNISHFPFMEVSLGKYTISN